MAGGRYKRREELLEGNHLKTHVSLLQAHEDADIQAHLRMANGPKCRNGYARRQGWQVRVGRRLVLRRFHTGVRPYDNRQCFGGEGESTSNLAPLEFVRTQPATPHACPVCA